MKRYRYILQYTIALLLITSLLLACRAGKNYQQPDLQLPKQFSNQNISDTSSVADIEWKKFFTDPMLQNLIEKGLTYNADLLIAIKRMDIAQQQLKQSKLLQLPEINLLATVQISRPSDNSLSGINVQQWLGKSYIENYSAGINLSWEADIWGKIRRQKEVALANYLQTKEAAKAVQTQLIASLAQGFFNLLMLDKQLEVARKNLILSNNFLQATRLLKDAGNGTALAVQQAESQRQTVSLLILQLEQNTTLQEKALQLLTGQAADTIIRQVTLNTLTINNKLSTGLPVAMVSRRPDVRASELDLVRANAQVGIANANMYPALNITAGGGLESFMASNWFSIPSSLFGLAAGSIAQPIFKRRSLKTQFEVTKLQREQAVIQFRQAVLQATIEVANALIRLDKLKQQQQIANEQVGMLQQAANNAQLLFKSDMANYLEVITIQENVLRSELNLAFIQQQQLGAAVELYRSLGGGWK